MTWFWKVRIHREGGHYWHAQIRTGQRLAEIDIIQDFYFQMTGCKMLLEGMSEKPFDDTCYIGSAFVGLWLEKRS